MLNSTNQTMESVMYIPTSLREQDLTQSQFLNEVWQVWIQSFPSLRPVDKNFSFPYNLTIAGGRIVGFILFPMILLLYEMQTLRPEFERGSPWPFSYDRNHYTTNASYIYIYTWGLRNTLHHFCLVWDALVMTSARPVLGDR